ncbi:hypothetical protein AYO20_11006 [Fonsecaea nubica]|uniref:Uncharacterized protein n=1 Tax=Fonsecaea nubica TaxID=856822 RepID=A0A178C152_9EURO|nr:hypothetical protein AYO20_11006 [Fonsecaea nubica]OAL23194.1 hypothetical protein AYO20_11006 [Fonsecaea nubica]
MTLSVVPVFVCVASWLRPLLSPSQGLGGLTIIEQPDPEKRQIAQNIGRYYLIRDQTSLFVQIALEENGNVGSDQMKTPRGILDYKLAGYDDKAMSWKLTGNLGGENYVNRSRGPLNERSMYAEHQG